MLELWYNARTLQLSIAMRENLGDFKDENPRPFKPICC
jgi:hypothetical protein